MNFIENGPINNYTNQGKDTQESEYVSKFRSENVIFLLEDKQK